MRRKEAPGGAGGGARGTEDTQSLREACQNVARHSECRQEKGAGVSKTQQDTVAATNAQIHEARAELRASNGLRDQCLEGRYKQRLQA